MTGLSGCTIAFDLDGTLVDTAPDLHRALVEILAAEGLPPATLADVRAFVGLGARTLIIRGSAVHGVIHDDDKLDVLTERFVSAYAADIAARSVVWPGVANALDALAASGATLCVCTNKLTGLSNQLLEAVGLARHFAAVVGADSVRRRKPHPEHYIAAIRAAKGEVGRSLMVGDSISDVSAAKAANAPVVLVSFGYTDTAPELLGADAVFTHYDDLPGLAARMLEPA
ncbi:MAG: phosphoglycolate phosphatase [Alphaproteobacteria bacterium]|nr:phosphoglycolate phosphatase [Alphaproteobacteria bacterium]